MCGYEYGKASVGAGAKGDYLDASGGELTSQPATWVPLLSASGDSVPLEGVAGSSMGGIC